MQAGALDRRIRLLSYRAGAANDFGEPGSPTWDQAAVLWASKRDLSDAERVAAQAVGAILTTRFVVRSSTITRAIKPQDRIEYDGRTYDVVSQKEIGRRDGIEITAASAEQAA